MLASPVDSCLCWLVNNHLLVSYNDGTAPEFIISSFNQGQSHIIVCRRVLQTTYIAACSIQTPPLKACLANGFYQSQHGMLAKQVICLCSRHAWQLTQNNAVKGSCHRDLCPELPDGIKTQAEPFQTLHMAC